MKSLLYLLLPLLLSASHEEVLFKTLDPNSIQDQVTFYSLYPDSPLGTAALQRTFTLLGQHYQPTDTLSFEKPLKALFHREDNCLFDSKTLSTLNALAKKLPNRHLKGHSALEESEILNLEAREIDLARAILITELEGDPEKEAKIHTYEALLDLIALQIMPYLNSHSPDEKIAWMNRLIYEQIGVRYPPLTDHVKEIDTHSSLVSVVDSNRGVCLGTSILYLSLAQRLNLPLVAITPPGHIYVRYQEGDKVINIETTARGANIHTDHYISLEGDRQQVRDVKQVIALSYFNRASRKLREKNYREALNLYNKAEMYLQCDPLLQELIGFTCLFCQEETRGLAYLEKAVKHAPENTPFILAEDFLRGHASLEAIQTVLEDPEESFESLCHLENTLMQRLNEEPQFRAGYLTLAKLQLQLHKKKSAIETLKKYETLDAKSPFVHYLLAELSLEMHDFPSAKRHLECAELQTQHKKLKQLRQRLALLSPERFL